MIWTNTTKNLKIMFSTLLEMKLPHLYDWAYSHTQKPVSSHPTVYSSALCWHNGRLFIPHCLDSPAGEEGGRGPTILPGNIQGQDKHVLCQQRGMIYIQNRRQRSSLLFGAQNLFISLPHKLFCSRMICRKGWIAPGCYEEKDKFHQDDMKKRINSSYSSNCPAWQGNE